MVCDISKFETKFWVLFFSWNLQQLPQKGVLHETTNKMLMYSTYQNYHFHYCRSTRKMWYKGWGFLHIIMQNCLYPQKKKNVQTKVLYVLSILLELLKNMKIHFRIHCDLHVKIIIKWIILGFVCLLLLTIALKIWFVSSNVLLFPSLLLLQGEFNINSLFTQRCMRKSKA